MFEISIIVNSNVAIILFLIILFIFMRKIKERQLLPDDRQTILQDVIITLCRDSLFRLLKKENEA